MEEWGLRKWGPACLPVCLSSCVVDESDPPSNCHNRSGIYWTTEEQRQVAEASLARQNEKLGGQVVTELEKVRCETAC